MVNWLYLTFALINFAAAILHLSNARSARLFGEGTASHYRWAAVSAVLGTWICVTAFT